MDKDSIFKRYYLPYYILLLFSIISIIAAVCVYGKPGTHYEEAAMIAFYIITGLSFGVLIVSLGVISVPPQYYVADSIDDATSVNDTIDKKTKEKTKGGIDKRVNKIGDKFVYPWNYSHKFSMNRQILGGSKKKSTKSKKGSRVR